MTQSEHLLPILVLCLYMVGINGYDDHHAAKQTGIVLPLDGPTAWEAVNQISPKNCHLHGSSVDMHVAEPLDEMRGHGDEYTKADACQELYFLLPGMSQEKDRQRRSQYEGKGCSQIVMVVHQVGVVHRKQQGGEHPVQ